MYALKRYFDIIVRVYTVIEHAILCETLVILCFYGEPRPFGIVNDFIMKWKDIKLGREGGGGIKTVNSC